MTDNATAATIDAARRPHEWWALAGFAAPVIGTAVLGTRFGPADPDTNRWFRRLDLPPYQPPDRVFGPVWTTLYGCIAASGWRVWRRPAGRDRTVALGWWGAQLAANAAWTPAFFGLRRPRLALGVLAAQLLATAAYTRAAARVDVPAAGLFGPYLAWSGFAGVLNADIVRRNPN